MSLKRKKAAALRWGVIGLGQLLIASSFAVGASSVSAEMKSSFSKKQAAFTENVGQWNKDALFSARGIGVDLWINRSEIRFDYFGREKDANPQFNGHVVGMKFVGANPLVPVGSDVKGSKDIIKPNSSKLRAMEFRKVRINDVYKGVGLVSYFDQGNPRYDFHVAPNADPSQIKLQFKGVDAVRVSGKSLSYKTAMGTKKQTNLLAYQTVNGKRVIVPASFNVAKDNVVSFKLGAYDKSKELVIDPLIYGTYYGGDGGVDEVRGVTTDSASGVYLTGYTKAANYPVLYGPYSFNPSGGRDAFVSKLQGDAYNHDYSALIGGSADDQGNFIACDSFDNVWVCGTTASTNFPGGGTGRGWIMRFKPSQTTVLDPFEGGVPQIFRFGGTTLNSVNAFAVEKRQNPVAGTPILIRLAGNSTSAGIPQIAGPVSSTAFYLSLNYLNGVFSQPAGQSAYVPVGPGGTLSITGLALDSTGGFVVDGTLAALGNSDTAQGANPIFVTTPGAWPNSRLQRGNDIWVRRYSATGALLWSGLVGGAGSDTTEGTMSLRNIVTGSNPPRHVQDVTGTTISVGADNAVYVLGRTNSFDFPRTRGVFGEEFDGARSLITVTKLSADGTSIVYSTHINNANRTSASGIAVDPRGNAYITGMVYGTNTFPDTAGDPNEPTSTSIDANAIPTRDAIKTAATTVASPLLRVTEAWVFMLNPNGTDFTFGTFVGGPLEEGIFAPYTDRFGDLWVFGWIDTYRSYIRANAAGTTVNVRETNPGGQSVGFEGNFITPLAFKENPDPAGQEPDVNVAYGAGPWVTAGAARSPATLSNLTGPPFNAPDGWVTRRDGYLLRFRKSLPLLSNLTLAPAQIAGGDPEPTGSPVATTGTLTLSAAAPTGGATIFLTLDNANAASFEPVNSINALTVNVPAGATTATFQVFGRPVLDVQNVQVRADYAGNVRVAAFSVVPWLSSLALSTTTVVGGNEFTGIVNLQRAARAGGVVVNLTTDRPDVISFPDGATVTVPAGAATATFRVATGGVATLQVPRVNATLLGVTRSQTINVTQARLDRITFNPNVVAGGNATTGTVLLDGAAPAGGLSIDLSLVGAPAGYTLSPNPVTIPQNATSANFTVQTAFEGATVNRTVQAVRRNSSNVVIDGPVSGGFTVQAVNVASFSIDPTTIESGATATGTITLTQPAPTGGAIVQIFITNPSAQPTLVTGPATINIPAGQATGTVTFTGGFSLATASTASITAYRGPLPATGSNLTTFGRTASLTVNPITYSLSVTPTTLFGGDPATGTVTISAPAIAGFTMQVSSDDPSVTVNPTTLPFTTGSTTANFAITTPEVNVTRTVNIRAQAGSLPVVSVPLTIRSIDVVSAQLSRNRIRQQETVTLTVTTNAPVKRATAVTLNLSNSSLVDVIPAITIPAGRTSASVTLRAKRVPRTLLTTITATVSPIAGGPSASTTLTVTR